MIFLKIKSVILDHLMTISFTTGVYYAWFVQGNDQFIFKFSDYLLIYIIAYTFQTISVLSKYHLHSPGEFKAGIKLLNNDNTVPGKAKVLVRHLAYPIILINSLVWTPYSFVLLLYLIQKETDKNELIDMFTAILKLKYVRIKKEEQ